MVENQWGGHGGCLLHAARRRAWRSAPIRERLRKYRKMILELLLANHCRDCTTCENNGNCKLQDLAMRFDINGVRFPNTRRKAEDRGFVRQHRARRAQVHPLRRLRARMCNEVQNVGAIDFAHRGSKMTISTAFDMPACRIPLRGLRPMRRRPARRARSLSRMTSQRSGRRLTTRGTKVTVQIAPAVRVALGRELGIAPGENAMGRIVAALRRMGFDEIYDTSTSADLTVLEESNELAKRLGEGKAESAAVLFLLPGLGALLRNALSRTDGACFHLQVPDGRCSLR